MDTLKNTIEKIDFYLSAHAEEQRLDRYITMEEVEMTLREGKIVPAKGDRLKVVYYGIQLIIGKRYGRIAVVSCYYTKRFVGHAEIYAREKDITFYQAIREMRAKGMHLKKLPFVIRKADENGHYKAVEIVEKEDLINC